MKITKEQIKKSLKPVVNVAILVAVATASFKIGSVYQSSQKEEVKLTNPYAHAFSLKKFQLR
jgi:hypothetical protein